MIATLHGVLTEKKPSRLVVDVGGVKFDEKLIFGV